MGVSCCQGSMNMHGPYMTLGDLCVTVSFIVSEISCRRVECLIHSWRSSITDLVSRRSLYGKSAVAVPITQRTCASPKSDRLRHTRTFPMSRTSYDRYVEFSDIQGLLILILCYLDILQFSRQRVGSTKS